MGGLVNFHLKSGSQSVPSMVFLHYVDMGRYGAVLHERQRM